MVALVLLAVLDGGLSEVGVALAATAPVPGAGPARAAQAQAARRSQTLTASLTQWRDSLALGTPNFRPVAERRLMPAGAWPLHLRPADPAAARQPLAQVGHDSTRARRPRAREWWARPTRTSPGSASATWTPEDGGYVVGHASHDPTGSTWTSACPGTTASRGRPI